MRLCEDPGEFLERSQRAVRAGCHLPQFHTVSVKSYGHVGLQDRKAHQLWPTPEPWWPHPGSERGRERATPGALGGVLCLLWDRKLCGQWEGAGLASQQDHTPHPGASGASSWLSRAQQGEEPLLPPLGTAYGKLAGGRGTEKSVRTKRVPRGSCTYAGVTDTRWDPGAL